MATTDILIHDYARTGAQDGEVRSERAWITMFVTHPAFYCLARSTVHGWVATFYAAPGTLEYAPGHHDSPESACEAAMLRIESIRYCDECGSATDNEASSCPRCGVVFSDDIPDASSPAAPTI